MMKFDEIIKKIRGTIFIILAILFALAFVVIGVIYGYSFFTNKEILNSSTGNLINLPDEVIIGLLEILLSFAGVISYLVYKVVSRDLEIKVRTKIKTLGQNERKASRAEVCTTLSYILGEFYQRNREKFADFLRKALKFNEEAFNEIRNLPKGEYQKIIYRVKNNLACDLADLQYERNKQGKGIDLRNKERAMQLKNEIWELIKSGEISKYSDEPYEDEETCAWVIWNFAESEEEKQKALQIIQNLEERYPPERYLEIKKGYGL